MRVVHQAVQNRVGIGRIPDYLMMPQMLTGKSLRSGSLIRITRFMAVACRSAIAARAAVRTVRDYEQAGVAAIHIEDQLSPKRCGHLDDKQIVPREDWIAKIRAAAAARRDPDFLIIARTDSRAVAGFEEAIARANAALANGADMAFVEAPQTLEELAAVPRQVNGPCLLNVVWGGKTPMLDMREAAALGFKLAIVPALAVEGEHRRLR